MKRRLKLLEPEIIKAYNNDQPVRDIMATLKLTLRDLYSVLDKNKLRRRRKLNHLENPYFLEDVSRLHKEGLLQKEIAKRLNVSIMTVCHALRKRGFS